MILKTVANWTPAGYPYPVEDKKTQLIHAKEFANLPGKERAKFLKRTLKKHFQKSPELLDVSISILKEAKLRPSLESIEKKSPEYSKLVAENE